VVTLNPIVVPNSVVEDTSGGRRIVVDGFFSDVDSRRVITIGFEVVAAVVIGETILDEDRSVGGFDSVVDSGSNTISGGSDNVVIVTTLLIFLTSSSNTISVDCGTIVESSLSN
jgi:hypothetical protein